MAPSNMYLLDDTARQRLIDSDPKLIKASSSWFPGDPQPEVHWDFNRSREFEKLTGFINSFSDIEYHDGKVAVMEACRAVYGFHDEGLATRIAHTHLHPASQFNKKYMNGQVVMVGRDGEHIMRNDRLQIAKIQYIEAAQKFEQRVGKTAVAASKSLVAQRKRSLRIAPGIENELEEITDEATDKANEGTRQAATGK